MDDCACAKTSIPGTLHGQVSHILCNLCWTHLCNFCWLCWWHICQSLFWAHTHTTRTHKVVFEHTHTIHKRSNSCSAKTKPLGCCFFAAMILKLTKHQRMGVIWKFCTSKFNGATYQSSGIQRGPNMETIQTWTKCQKRESSCYGCNMTAESSGKENGQDHLRYSREVSFLAVCLCGKEWMKCFVLIVAVILRRRREAEPGIIGLR